MSSIRPIDIPFFSFVQFSAEVESGEVVICQGEREKREIGEEIGNYKERRKEKKRNKSEEKAKFDKFECINYPF